jgi:hypothetical protein
MTNLEKRNIEVKHERVNETHLEFFTSHNEHSQLQLYLNSLTPPELSSYFFCTCYNVMCVYMLFFIALFI